MMDDGDRDPSDIEPERLLRAARVPAAPAWRTALESRLFEAQIPHRRSWTGARQALRARPRRPALAGALAAAALAAIVLVASLAGAGPLASDGSDAVKAGDNCRYVLEHVRAPVARVVGDGRGGTRVVVERRLVTRRTRHCR